MDVNWADLGFFIALLIIFVYVLAVNNLTTIHKSYLAFHFSMMMWPICQFVMYITSDQYFQWFFLSSAFLGLCYLGFGWLIFSLTLIQKINSIDSKKLYLTAGPAVLCAVLIATNPWHYMFAQPVHGEWIVRTYGPFFWFFVICSLIYLTIASGLIYYTMKRLEKGNRKKQLSLCMWGIILLVVLCLSDVLVNVILLPEIVVPGLTSTGIILSALCFVTAIQKYDLFKIVTMAQHDAINSMDTGIIILDKDDVILDLNISAAKYINYRNGQVLKIEDLLEYSQNKTATSDFLGEYRRSNRHYIKTEIVFHKEHTVYFSINVSPVIDQSNNLLGRVITINDVSELHELLEQVNENNKMLKKQNKELLMVHEELSAAYNTLEELATTDYLTGCYNRRYLLQRFEYEIALAHRYQKPFSIILFDLDKFKLINDTYGHLVGDVILCGVVKVVRQNLRKTDILSRFGGEEFLIYAPGTGKKEAITFAERIRAEVEGNCIETSGGEIYVTISMGIVSLSDEALETLAEPPIENLLNKADLALYEAKSRGRNCVVVQEYLPDIQ